MRLAMLKVTLVVLVGTTWIFWSFVLSTRPEEAPTHGPLMSLMRLPASLPTSLPAQIPGMVPIVKTMDPIEMNVMKLACWDKSDQKDRTTAARWIRLTGRDCGGDANAERIVVLNLNNGFSATVFPTQGKLGLTTDFIPLREGRNQIQILVDRDGGAKVESRFDFFRE